MMDPQQTSLRELHRQGAENASVRFHARLPCLSKKHDASYSPPRAGRRNREISPVTIKTEQEPHNWDYHYECKQSGLLFLQGASGGPPVATWLDPGSHAA